MEETNLYRCHSSRNNTTTSSPLKEAFKTFFFFLVIKWVIKIPDTYSLLYSFVLLDIALMKCTDHTGSSSLELLVHECSEYIMQLSK